MHKFYQRPPQQIMTIDYCLLWIDSKKAHLRGFEHRGLRLNRLSTRIRSGSNHSLPMERALSSLITSHAEGGRIDVHVAFLHHLPHLLVQLAVAAHALHHLA